MGDTTYVREIPRCDLCAEDRTERPAVYDARLSGYGGTWANVCEPHWRQYGPGRLGTGYGQRFVLGERPEPAGEGPARRALRAMLEELLGDDPDAIESELEDAEYLGLI